MPSLFSSLFDSYQDRLKKQSLKASEDVILVDLGEQKLFLAKHGQEIFSAAVSGSRKPMSCLQDSEGTPWGLHEVVEKYGENAAPGTVFIGRVDKGETYFERPDHGPDQKTLITTRILRLRGLEPGLNLGDPHDSYNRYIYVHGVNHPERFPEPQSCGCLNLLDEDLIPLFDKTAVGSHLFIADPR